MPRRRRIPATTAEFHAWNWGAEQSEDEQDWMTHLALERADPGEHLQGEARKAWDRLGARRFWEWAITGFHARAMEDAE